MAIAKKSLAEFVNKANNGVRHLTTNAAAKERWHRLGRGLAKTLAKKMGMPEGSYDIRSCKGGPAVSGEIVLHSDWLYVQFGISCFGLAAQFMYRTCDGRKDYTGGMNRWMHFKELLDLDKVAAKLAECKGGD